jgi:hypothetical protein
VASALHSVTSLNVRSEIISYDYNLFLEGETESEKDYNSECTGPECKQNSAVGFK